MLAQDRIIHALDVATFEEAQESVKKLAGSVGMFKVGKELFTAVGPRVIEWIQSRGEKVFLDLKYFDIPDTVAKAALQAAVHGVSLFNLHIEGGEEMMKKTMAAVANRRTRPKVLGVTLLTSQQSPDVLASLGLPEGTLSINVEQLVVHRAKWGKACGLDGVIASAKEARAIRKALGWEFTIVTPGIRSAGKEVHDQQRVQTPEQAIANGADYLVMGRQLSQAKDVEAEVKKVAEEIRLGMRTRIARRLREIKAVDFDIEEGWKIKIHKQYADAPKSPFYIDQRIVRSYPRFASDVVDLYVALLNRMGVRPDLLCEVPTAATPIVSLMADRTGIPMISPRMDVKTHGMERAIDGVWQRGQTVVVVDDLRTTGGSKKEVIDILRAAGLNVLRVIALIDRSAEDGRVENIPFHAEYTWAEMLALYKEEGVITEEEYSQSAAYPQELASYIARQGSAA